MRENCFIKPDFRSSKPMMFVVTCRGGKIRTEIQQTGIVVMKSSENGLQF